MGSKATKHAAPVGLRRLRLVLPFTRSRHRLRYDPADAPAGGLCNGRLPRDHPSRLARQRSLARH